jgi:hypothetical protein
MWIAFESARGAERDFLSTKEIGNGGTKDDREGKKLFKEGGRRQMRVTVGSTFSSVWTG